MGEREREAVKVIVRCRPMNKREKDLKCKPVVYMENRTLQCSIQNPNEPNSPPKNFTFDGVYHTDSTTEQIYNDNGFDLVEGVLEGYNGTVFAYGQTGCGKSFSMQGIRVPETQRGIIPRSFEHVFETIDAKENMKYLVHASYLEIYNEEIRDLLGQDIKKKLDLKEHPDKGVYVQDISLHPVHNTQECEDLMQKGWENRATGATKMNLESSRSHSIFTINIEMMDTGPTGGEHIRKGKLNLVDLAGSERQSKTGASGDRLKEATKINLSLSALGNVISALVDGKSKHIPYRDSKLTRLLQDSLGGNTKTMMVACLSPADNNYEETLSTLRYANRAKNIKNKPKINQDPKDALLAEYQTEIQKLKELLALNPNAGDQVPNEAILEAERERVRSEYEQEMEEVRKKLESEKQSKAKIQKEVDEMKKQYEEKLSELNERAKTGSSNTRTQSQAVVDPSQPHKPGLDSVVSVEEAMQKDDPVNLEQQEAMEKLKKLQASMVDGGKRAGDMDLKERRLKRKKAAEKRLKALGEALGHVDDEDGVLVKVYDDIQEELNVKTAALKKGKKKILALNSEIGDLQYEFEKDRTDYLDTIRKQDQQIKLFQQIIEKVQPTIRKDCNYSNLERIKQDSVWNDEQQRWKVPELVVQKTKLPPAAGSYGGFGVEAPIERIRDGGDAVSRTAPGRLEGVETDTDEEDNNALFKKLARSEEEDVVGNYFKPKRATRLVAQAQETKRAANGLSKSGNSLHTSNNSLGNSTLSSSYNSGLNTSGLNNSYGTTATTNGGFNGSHTWGPSTSPSSWAGANNGSTNVGSVGGGGYGGGSSYNGGGSYGTSGGGGGGVGGSYGAYGTFSSGIYPNSDLTPLRKPSRLEALPTLDKKHNTKKKSMPMLNTMGTF